MCLYAHTSYFGCSHKCALDHPHGKSAVALGVVMDVRRAFRAKPGASERRQRALGTRPK
jgi:hypothetical protein